MSETYSLFGADGVAGEQGTSVAFTKSIIPIGWVALFDSSCVAEIVTKDGARHERLVSDRKAALARLADRRPRIERWFGEEIVEHLDALQEHLTNVPESHVAVTLWREPLDDETAAFRAAFFSDALRAWHDTSDAGPKRICGIALLEFRGGRAIPDPWGAPLAHYIVGSIGT
jgi:hypothetical protein